MKRQIRLLAMAGLLCAISINGFSQFSISYYASNLSKIGLAYDFGDKVRAELRLYSDTHITDITPELVFCFNIVRREQHNIYLGLGGNFNYFSGLVVPVGVQFSPFEKLDGFSFHIELEPTIDFPSGGFIIQSAWGLRYKFVRKT